MSQIVTAPTPLWKPGTRNDNVHFLSSFSRLQKEDPELYSVIEQKEGFECTRAGYSYKVGYNKFGLYCLRRKEVPGLEAPNKNEKDIFTQQTNVVDHTLILALTQLADAIKLQTLTMLASSPEEKEDIRKKVMAT